VTASSRAPDDPRLERATLLHESVLDVERTPD
jgi:hypothetical protein